MATNTVVAHGKRGVHKVTMTANAEDTVTFDRPGSTVRVISFGGVGDLYVTTGPVANAATVGGSNCEVIPAGATGVLQLDVADVGPVTVRLVSSAACVYSVTMPL